MNELKEAMDLIENMEPRASAKIGLSDSNALVILQHVPKESMSIQPFRSGGFINKDYDMARVQIDLPILEAKRLIAALKAI